MPAVGGPGGAKQIFPVLLVIDPARVGVPAALTKVISETIPAKGDLRAIETREPFITVHAKVKLKVNGLGSAKTTVEQSKKDVA